MTDVFFCTDIHGSESRCESLFRIVREKTPSSVFVGGDLLPGGLQMGSRGDFLQDVLLTGLKKLKSILGNSYPVFFVILGNDDGKYTEESLLKAERQGLLMYAHNRRFTLGQYTVYGYSFIPPTPFRLKDWEKYDVSRFVDPGCTHPFQGMRTIPAKRHEIEYSTIQDDLEKLTGTGDLSKSIFLFHSPPYGGYLDRAALDGKLIDHVPLDVHVGSIAISRFIEKKQPAVTLHGHVHESVSITGRWMEKRGNTVCMNAAHNGPELALVSFDVDNPAEASRILL